MSCHTQTQGHIKSPGKHSLGLGLTAHFKNFNQLLRTSTGLTHEAILTNNY
jgi:hypothetical protein